jgi:hypothetical protein
VAFAVFLAFFAGCSVPGAAWSVAENSWRYSRFYNDKHRCSLFPERLAYRGEAKNNPVEVVDQDCKGEKTHPGVITLLGTSVSTSGSARLFDASEARLNPAVHERKRG